MKIKKLPVGAEKKFTKTLPPLLIDEADFQSLQNYCAENGVNRSEFMREAIREHLKRKKKAA